MRPRPSILAIGIILFGTIASAQYAPPPAPPGAFSGGNYNFAPPPAPAGTDFRYARPGYVMPGAPYGAYPGDGRTRNWHEGHPYGRGWEYADAVRAAHDPCYGSSVLHPQCRGYGAYYGHPYPAPPMYGYGGGINVTVIRQQTAVQQPPMQPMPTYAPPHQAAPNSQQPVVTTEIPPYDTFAVAAQESVKLDLSGTPSQPPPSGSGKTVSGRRDGPAVGDGVDKAARQGVAHLAEEVKNLNQRMCDEETRNSTSNPKCKEKK